MFGSFRIISVTFDCASNSVAYVRSVFVFSRICSESFGHIRFFFLNCVVTIDSKGKVVTWWQFFFFFLLFLITIKKSNKLFGIYC